MTKTANCLNLVGDGDDVDVLYAVEEAFAVRISDEEAIRCETVGDLFDIVSSKLKASEARHFGCPTALAFFRLRGALGRLGYRQRITPKANLRAIFSAQGTRRFQLSLSREADLKLPDIEFHSVSIAAIAITMACGTAFAVWIGSWLPLLGVTVLAIVLGFLLPKTIPDEITNLGDYAVNCAAWNYGRLSEQSGVRPRDVWKALTTVVRESTGTNFAGEMNYDTRFFAERRNQAR
jgi:hypothetical protein